MKRTIKAYGIPLFLLLVKFLTALRTGTDTYAVTQDWLNVIMLDGMFTAFWLALAYGSGGKVGINLRWFALFATYALYGFMLYIGWEAHHDIISIGVRISPAIAIAYDGWDLIQAGQAYAKAHALSAEEKRRRLRERIYNSTYALVARIARVGLFVPALRHAWQDYATDFNVTQAKALARQPRTQSVSAGARSTNYVVREDKRIECVACGWVSPNTYADKRSAGNAYSGHARSHARIDALDAVIVQSQEA